MIVRHDWDTRWNMVKGAGRRTAVFSPQPPTVLLEMECRLRGRVSDSLSGTGAILCPKKGLGHTNGNPAPRVLCEPAENL